MPPRGSPSQLRRRFARAENRLGQADAPLAAEIEDDVSRAMEEGAAPGCRRRRPPARPAPCSAAMRRPELGLSAGSASVQHVVQLDHHAGPAAGSAPVAGATPGAAGARPRGPARSRSAVDRHAGLDPARQAGRGRQLGQIVQAYLGGQCPHRRLVDPGLDQRMAHAMLRRGLEPGRIVAEIVEIGAGRHRPVGVAADGAIEVQLAEEAAVDRVGAVGAGRPSRRRRSPRSAPAGTRCVGRAPAAVASGGTAAEAAWNMRDTRARGWRRRARPASCCRRRRSPPPPAARSRPARPSSRGVARVIRSRPRAGAAAARGIAAGPARSSASALTVTPPSGRSHALGADRRRRRPRAAARGGSRSASAGRWSRSRSGRQSATASTAAGIAQHLHRRRQPPLLAERRPLADVAHRRPARAAGRGRSPDPRPSGRRSRSGSRRPGRRRAPSSPSNSSARSRLGTPSSIRVPKPMAGRGDACRCRHAAASAPDGAGSPHRSASRARRRCRRRSTGRPSQQESGRRCRDRQRAVRASAPGRAPSGNGPVAQLAAPSRLDQPGGGHDVERSCPSRPARGSGPRRPARRGRAPRPRPAGGRSRAPAPRPRRRRGSLPPRRSRWRAAARRRCASPGPRPRSASRPAHGRRCAIRAQAARPAGSPAAGQRRRPAAPPAPGSASSRAAANMSPAMPPSGSRWMRAMRSGGMDRDDIGPLGHEGDAAGRRAGPCCRPPRPRPRRSRSTPVGAAVPSARR